MTKREKKTIADRIIKLEKQYDDCHVCRDNLINLDSENLYDRDIAHNLYGNYRGEAHAIYEELTFLKKLIRE